MNALLIYNDNLPTPLIENFKSQLKFSITRQHLIEKGFSIDKHIHFDLEKKLKEKKYDVIFLPYSLSESNYLSLTGLRIAHHIRLTPDFNHSHIPIVFIGHETPAQLAKLTPLANILFTTGVFLTNKFDFSSYSKQYKWITQSWKKDKEPILNDQEYQNFINKIKIKPPGNYKTHHSIDNELALLYWSEVIGCDNEIPEVKNNLRTGLYFKYIKAVESSYELIKFNISNYLYHKKKKSKNRKQTNNKTSLKVLLIDDEAIKGWGKFYEHFFKEIEKNWFENNTKVEVETLNINFKTNIQQEIIEKAEEKIIKYNPDVVLLDLRLHDNDFKKEIQTKDFTGCQILNKIKNDNTNINRGIEVIITTASNKAWNMQKLMQAGANGYIIKNHQAENLHNLSDLIINSFDKAPFLKEIWKKTKNIQDIYTIKLKQKELDKDFVNRINSLLELGFESIFFGKYSFNSAFMYYFFILEAIFKKKIDDDKSRKKNYTFRGNSIKLSNYDENGNKIISKISKLTYYIKLLNVLDYIKINDFNASEIQNLIKIRNTFIHQNHIDSKNTIIIQKEDFDFLAKITFNILENL